MHLPGSIATVWSTQKGSYVFSHCNFHFIKQSLSFLSSPTSNVAQPPFRRIVFRIHCFKPRSAYIASSRAPPTLRRAVLRQNCVESCSAKIASSRAPRTLRLYVLCSLLTCLMMLAWKELKMKTTFFWKRFLKKVYMADFLFLTSLNDAFLWPLLRITHLQITAR